MTVKIFREQPHHDTAIESDVVKEEKRKIRRFDKDDIDNYQLVARDLTKIYGMDNLALNQFCLAVDKNECFGILGESGAGKTTAVRLMTGDLVPTAGHVWIEGYSLEEERSHVLRRVGYCPQFEGLLEDLTGYETLKIIALIRGISENKMEYTINRLAEEFYFTKHLDKKTGQYSGGNKRKVNTAITLIGNTSIIFLDEPTTGIDPAARKQLWHVTNTARECRKTIVLTTQMVEECEALCTRLGIMVKGSLACIGEQEYLKDRYLKGYMVRIKLAKEDRPRTGASVERAKNYLQVLFLDAVLKEEYLDTLAYFIPSTFRTIPEVYEAIYQGREFLHIEDFSIQHANLEQIFVYLNQQQAK